MKNTNSKQTDNSVILPFQRPVFGQLCAVARASLFVDRSQFKVLKPRCNFWLIGPSGSGKTHLSKTLAQEIGVPIFSISVSDWVLIGAGSSKGCNNTWPLLIEFIIKNITQQGVIIFVDELDKCGGESEWSSFLRNELYSAFDARIPVGIKDSESNSISDRVIARVENFLKNKTMIIGGAAFQGVWENRNSNSMGFNPSMSAEASDPVLSELVNSQPRELVNRFSSQIFVLPQLKKQDYYDVITSMSIHIPEMWRERFVEIGIANLDIAVRDQKGARYAEETLHAAIVDVRAHLIQAPPQKEITKVDGLEFKNEDILRIF